MVSLKCPNCGAVIGEASHENNYIEKYYYKDSKGNPICKTCGTGDNGHMFGYCFLGILIFIIIMLVVMIKFS